MRLFGLLLLVPLFSAAQAEQEKIILASMLNACENLASASFILSTTERIKDGSTEKGEMLVKLNHNPLRLYLHLYNPNPGTELLYRDGEWDNQVYISLGGFPYLNIKMDPNHNTVRKNSHHSIRDIGFDYLARMIRHYQSVLGEKVYDRLALGDTVQFERHRCLKMEFDYPEFGYNTYTVKEGENVAGIAATNFVHEYMVICANKPVDNVHDVKAGQKLMIPNMFARKIIFYVSLKSMLPLIQEIHDDKGFFERYEYKSFVLNPGIDPAEFTPDFTGYGF
jgi:outer membrane lipoprotein-sorting protein